MAGISSKALKSGYAENKYKFNGIEQNNDFDLNMYDAFYRNLDPQIGRFWQIDPKLENTEAWTLYVSMHNNPILLNDPLGDFDDYQLKQDGKIELIKRTDDKNDKLYASNSKGEVDKKNSIEVKKGVLETKTDGKATNPETGKETNTSTITVTNDTKGATKLFEFIAKNTSVEFGITNTKMGDGKLVSAITTSFEKYQNLGQSSYEYDILLHKPTVSILESIHSHPNPDNQQPSGFNPNGTPNPAFGGDRATAEYWEKYYKKGTITRKVYVPSTGTYYDYNSKKFTKE
jgi:RHS repeat-associated protein